MVSLPILDNRTLHPAKGILRNELVPDGRRKELLGPAANPPGRVVRQRFVLVGNFGHQVKAEVFRIARGNLVHRPCCPEVGDKIALGLPVVYAGAGVGVRLPLFDVAVDEGRQQWNRRALVGAAAWHDEPHAGQLRMVGIGETRHPFCR